MRTRQRHSDRVPKTADDVPVRSRAATRMGEKQWGPWRSVTVTASMVVAIFFLPCLALAATGFAWAAPKATQPAEVSHTAGLERYQDYESIETGAGARAHVNLATGNVVWHVTPLVNPGRGLSTFLNLTYNTQDKGGQGVTSGPGNEANGPNYAQAGQNFSLGISGMTRLNEPLGVPQGNGGVITLYDADGTRHRFTKATDGVTFDPPAGVNLHLRRFSDTDPLKAWAATRPDGITHYFDRGGYQRTIEDRNGNVIRFEYEALDQGNAAKCDAAIAGNIEANGQQGAGCKQRVVRVTDSAGVVDTPPSPGRSVTVSYYDDKTSEPGGSPGRIKQIVDHAGRILALGYDSRGYLISMTEAKGTPVERTTRFGYEGQGQNLDLATVRDPRGNTTRITYDGQGAKKRVASLINRRNQTTRFRYDTVREGSQQFAIADVTDARGFVTRHKIDELARPVEITDARKTRMTLTWDGDNNVVRLAQAVGTPDEAVNQMTYNGNGRLTSQLDPEGHRTELVYRNSAGTQLTQLGTDVGRTFVSDLVAFTTPKGTETPAAGDFTERYEPDERGNVRARINAEGFRAETDFDARGQITEERDEVGNRTQYGAFHRCGVPQERIDPRGGRYLYRYDSVCNVLAVTDPRGTQGADAGDVLDLFTTTLGYDALDRVVSERLPKLSTEGQFITRARHYDPNGNLTASIDGNGQRTEKTYTPMDHVEELRSPPSQHFGENGAASEVSRFDYDPEDNLSQLTRPLGTATAQADDYSTAFAYDEIGQRVAEVRRSRGNGPSKDLATSYAYDRRGNVIGLVDPIRNAKFGGAPEVNATVEGRRRFTYTYDKADNRRFAIEDPGGLALKQEWRYDANDNVVAHVDPRGFQSPNSPDQFASRREYDQRDLLVAKIDAKGNREQFTLRGDGKLAAKTSPRGTASAQAGDFETGYEYFPTGELESWKLPTAPNQYGGSDLTVSYQRDAAGNPTKITDGRGNTFDNAFFDTGQLRSTTRPGFYAVRAGGSHKELAVQERSPEDLMAGGGAPPEQSHEKREGDGDFGSVDPEPLPGLLPRAGSTSLTYDNEMRLTGVTDAAGKVSTVGYDAKGRVIRIEQPYDGPTRIVQQLMFDRNGNLRRYVDGEQNATTTDFDQFDRAVKQTAPGTKAVPDEISVLTYDDNDNVVARQTPRGTDFMWRMQFDSVDRLTSRTDPAKAKTTFSYDAAGNRTSETSPRGNRPNLSPAERDSFTTVRTYNSLNQLVTERDGLGEQTFFEYDADGNQVKVDRPGARSGPDAPIERQITTRTFDGRNLPWTESQGTGDHKHTSVREFDGNGNLRRVVNPTGVDETTGLPKTTDPGGSVAEDSTANREATVYEYSADNIVTSIHQPWGERDDNDRRRFRQDFELDDLGRVRFMDAAYEWTRDDAKAGRTTYTHFDTGWIKTTSDPKLVEPETHKTIYDQTITYAYDLRGLQTLWKSSADRDDAAPDERDREIRRTYFPNGQLKERRANELKKGTDEVVKSRRYTYEYNPNRSMVEMRDHDKNRVTEMGYDAAEQKLFVDEKWDGGKDTKLVYDENGNVIGRRTDGTLKGDGYDGGKLTTFTFDVLDRETKSVVDPAGDAPKRTTETEYYPSGEKSELLKANQVTERWFYFNDGSLARNERKKGGHVSKDQVYTYDENGNRTKDERGIHTFNSRDQLRRWIKGSDYPDSGTTVDYTLNGSGAIEHKDEGGIESTYEYIGDRLDTVDVKPGGTTQYRYDQFGSVTKIEGSQDVGFTYDPFERLLSSSGAGADLTYDYDGLDRMQSRTEGATSKTLSYIGTSNSISQETNQDKSTASYDYDSALEVMGRSKGTGDTETGGTYKSYGKDANGSVEGLEEPDGKFKPGNRYLYDPYGNQERQNEDEVEGTNEEGRANPFRFQSFIYDSAIKQYDMHARQYRPEIGRFTSQDRFESSRHDFNLQADPLTQNRYAFAGGNPVYRVEFDGHFGWDDVKGVAGDVADKASDVASDVGDVAEEGWKKTRGAVHTGLDAAGFVPGLGAVPDLINAGIYAAEGDLENAAWSAGAAVPLVGDAAKGGKMAAKGLRAVKKGSESASPLRSTYKSLRAPLRALGHNRSAPRATRSVSYTRPSGYRSGVRARVWDDAIEPATGRVRDPVTGRFMGADNAWDMGHRPGHEFRKFQASAQKRGISRTQFLDEYNDPSHYRPELPPSNRSHRGENLTDEYFGP